MRYNGEVRLRLIGPRAECIKHIPDARNVLGELWNGDRVLGGLETASRRVVRPDGTKISVQFYSGDAPPIITIEVALVGMSQEAEQRYLIRAVWEPEGIVMTPSKGREDDGDYIEWGLPSRKLDITGERLELELDDEGAPTNEVGLTDNGSLPQVILNRFANNKYLDVASTITNIPEEVLTAADESNRLLAGNYDSAGSTDIIYQHWHTYDSPWSYTLPDDGGYEGGYYEGAQHWLENPDTEVAGIYRVQSVEGQVVQLDVLLAQYDEFGDANFYEAPAANLGDGSEQWFVHKVEEVLYPSPIFEDIFQYTNGLREAVGEEPVYRMIRGDGNGAYMACYQLTQSDPPGLFFHSHEDFQPGYRTTSGRCQNATGREAYTAYAHNIRENLLVLPPGVVPEDVTVGDFVAQQWESSPPHYSNMVLSMWTDFSIPYFTYLNGTKGASHQIGSYGASDYTLRDAAGSDPAENISVALTPPVEGGTAFAQLFTNKETWVPIFDALHTTPVGTAGTFNGSNPYSHANYPSSRRVGTGRHIYELPSSLVPPQFLSGAPEEDDFLSCVGCALIERGGEKWMRVVYWESDTVTDTTDHNEGTYPAEGDYTRLKVAIFPLRLQESSEMPYRKDIPGEAELEYEYEFLLADGWLSNPPSKVTFDSTGERFCFTHHKIGSTYTQALDYSAVDFTEDRSDLANPRAAIQCVHFECDMALAGSPGYLMAEFAPIPLIAQVTCWTGDPDETYTDSEYTKFYERTLVGQYEVFPHYATNNVGVEELTYLTLDINEYQVQKGNPAWAGGADLYPDKVSYCWRIRKLIFPSEKELVYMQQYMVGARTALPWDVDQNPNEYSMPGTGEESFYCVIHYMDEVLEDLVYSKIVTMKRRWEFDNRAWYRTNGDITYMMDLYPKTDPANTETPDQIIEELYVIPEDNDYSNDGDLAALLALNIPEPHFSPPPPLTPGEWVDDESIIAFPSGLPDSTWIYAMDNTPCTFLVQEDSRYGWPAGYVSANTSGHTVPDVGATELFSPDKHGDADGNYVRPQYRVFPEASLDAPFNRQAFDDYEVSAYTGYQYYGDSNIWYFGTGKKALSFMNTNIMPMFGKPGETECKVLRYDGRIVMRLGIDHVHKVGILPPPGLRPAATGFTWGEWTLVYPPEDAEVLLWSNFDLDEALGMSDVRDIWPMGKIV